MHKTKIPYSYGLLSSHDPLIGIHLGILELRGKSSQDLSKQGPDVVYAGL